MKQRQRKKIQKQDPIRRTVHLRRKFKAFRRLNPEQFLSQTAKDALEKFAVDQAILNAARSLGLDRLVLKALKERGEFSLTIQESNDAG